MRVALKHPAKIGGGLIMVCTLCTGHPKFKKKRKRVRMPSPCCAQLIKRGPQQGDIFLAKSRSCAIKRAAIRD